MDHDSLHAAWCQLPRMASALRALGDDRTAVFGLNACRGIAEVLVDMAERRRLRVDLVCVAGTSTGVWDRLMAEQDEADAAVAHPLRPLLESMRVLQEHVAHVSLVDPSEQLAICHELDLLASAVDHRLADQLALHDRLDWLKQAMDNGDA